MTLTRARQHQMHHSLSHCTITEEHQIHRTDDHDQNHDEDICAPKQRVTRASAMAPALPSPSAISLLRNGLSTSMKRAVSSPSVFNAKTMTSMSRVRCTSNSSSSCNKSTTAHTTNSSAPTSVAPSLTRRGTSFGPRRPSAAADGSDSSDDDDGASSSFRSRYGGCSSDVDPSDKRDDSNKENIAPFRSITDEARDAERDSSARRNTPRASLTLRRSSSSASSVTSSVRSSDRPTSSRRSNNVSAEYASNSSPAVMRRTSSRITSIAPTTPESRKRQRPQTDTDGFSTGAPSTPMTRLRIEAPSQDGESYFSSQDTSTTIVSSLFDAESQHSSNAYSRATSPEVDGCSDADPKTALPQALYSNVYAHARALLRYAAGTSLEAPVSSPSATPSSAAVDEARSCSPGVQVDGSDVQVIGRDQERRSIHAFMAKRFGIFSSPDTNSQTIEELLDGNADSGSLYICGLPGTGKTALVRSVLSEVLSLAETEASAPRIAFVNCMAVDHPRQIFVKVLAALGETVKGASESHTEAEAERKMDKLVNQSSRKTLIVLDEIDHLLRSRAHQNVLYRLFAWASEGTSCGLVGIANSLDLTERFVPLLASKGAAPALLHFRPFESKEIVEVLTARLSGLRPRYDGEAEDEAMNSLTVGAGAGAAPTVLPLFMPAALELASKKIAAATGDLRKALDTARLAVEMVEGEQRKQALVNCTASGTGTNTEASKLLSHLTPSSAPKVTPSHIVKVLNAVLGSPHLGKIRQLGLQAKLILAAYLVAEKRAAAGLSVLGSTSNAGKRSCGMTTCAGAGSLRLADVEATYGAMLSNEGSFTALESSEVLEIFQGLEVQGTLSLGTEAETSVSTGSVAGHASSTGSGTSSSSSSSSGINLGSGVSPGGKRAAKKQLLASNRVVRLLLPCDDVHKGITTVASTLGSQASEAPSQAIVDCLKKMLNFEEERIRRSRGWEEGAKAREEVRREELGGGRMALGI